MKEKLKQVKEELEYIEFSTHMSCDTFQGKSCDSNTKQAYEEQLYLIGCRVKESVALIDSILATLDSQELVDKVAKICEEKVLYDNNTYDFVTNWDELAKAAIEAITV
jgi:hypothetical protein